MTVLAADWEAPARVRAFTTLRGGGVSGAPYDSLNLASHVGDDLDRVRQNRELLTQSQGWSLEPLWLSQVHGTTIVRAEDTQGVPEADGAVTSSSRPLVVLTADCLPVVACDPEGTVIGAFHAGWKGLLAGVLEAGLAAMGCAEVLVWIGPAIGASSYQVGPEVRDAFLAAHDGHEGDFTPDGARWRLDLAGAASRRLRRAGVGKISGGRWDTYSGTDLFFSHRRAAPCGRMATFISLNDVNERSNS